MYHFIIKTIPRPFLIKSSLVLKKISKFIFRGNRFHDPINGKGYWCFLPYGRHKATQRKNVLSPGTLSLERHRIMWLLLQRHTDFFSNSKNRNLLHVAPEQCFYKKFKSMSGIRYISADLVSPIADLKMDLHDIPFKDNYFDIIFCNHVLEHVEDDDACMRELFRVLKQGGWAILQVPIDESRSETLEDSSINTPELREKHYWQRDHLRLYGMDYSQKLSSVGFKYKKIEMEELASTEEMKKFALGKEPIYLFYK